MSEGPEQTLARALASLEAGDTSLALARMLDVWAQLRDAELGDAIERLSSRSAADLTPLSTTRGEALEREWHARAGGEDPRELAVLLPVVAQTTVREGRRRLDALAALRPDPRVASAMLEQLERLAFSATGGRFYTGVHQLLRHCADPRGVARLEALVGSFAERLGGSSVVEVHERQLARTLALVAAATRQRRGPSGVERAGIRALAEAVEARSDDAELGPRLLEQIRAEPDQRRHREVYADWLLARGDPHGEFIALQLANETKTETGTEGGMEGGTGGGLDRAGRARMRALEREHGRSWLGVLHWLLVRSSTRFAGGFVVEGRISAQARAPESFAGAPEWATVEILARAPIEIVRHPIMHALRRIDVSERVGVELLESPDPRARIEASMLDVDWPDHGGWAHAGRVRAALQQGQGLPGLREFGLRFGFEIGVDRLAWLWEEATCARLEAVEIELPLGAEVPLADTLARLRDQGPSLRRVCIGHPALRYRFEPGAEGHRWDRLAIEGRSPAGLGRALERLTAAPAELARLERVDVDPRLRAQAGRDLSALFDRLPG